jgi:hypothetical protein
VELILRGEVFKETFKHGVVMNAEEDLETREERRRL